METTYWVIQTYIDVDGDFLESLYRKCTSIEMLAF